MAGPSSQDARYRQVRQLVALLPEQVDVSNAEPIGEQLLRLIDHAPAVLIADMTATVSCDHAGAAALARVYQQALANGTELRLVISTPAVRRVIAISGLDRLVPVFPALEEARAERRLADVLPLVPRVARTGSATRPALPGGPRPVSRLDMGNTVNAANRALSERQTVLRSPFQEMLIHITSRVIQAGVTLQAAIGLPSAALEQAAEQALDVLSSTISEARTAAFALADPVAGNPSGRASGAGLPAGTQVLMVRGEDAMSRATRLVLEARQTRARCEKARARSISARARGLEIAGRAAATHQKVGATFSEIATTPQRHPGKLRRAAGA